MDPPPTDADNVTTINSTVEILDKLAEEAPAGPGVDAAKRLSADMTALAKADVSVRQRATTAFVQPLQTVLTELRSLLQAKEVTRETLPPDLVKQWMTPDGQARLEVAPSGNANDNTTLRAFAHDVLVVEPNGTEGPISILEARKTILAAFLEAGAFALLSIAILLWITLRRLGDVMLTLIPLLVAGVVTLEICVAIDMPLNFANIIALPLLLGVGVAFKIYYIMAWREGQTKIVAIGADPGGDIQRLHHGDRLWQPLFFQRSRHVEHGQASLHLAVDDDDGGGAVSAGAYGQAARREYPSHRASGRDGCGIAGHRSSGGYQSPARHLRRAASSVSSHLTDLAACCTPSAAKEETDHGEQNHHQLRDHRLDPHPHHVGRVADHA